MVKFDEVRAGDRLIYVGPHRACYDTNTTWEVMEGPPHVEDGCTLLISCKHSNGVGDYHSVAQELDRRGAWQLETGPW